MAGNYQIASITALILLVPSIAFMLVVERFLKADVLAKVGRWRPVAQPQKHEAPRRGPRGFFLQDGQASQFSCDIDLSSPRRTRLGVAEGHVGVRRADAASVGYHHDALRRHAIDIRRRMP